MLRYITIKILTRYLTSSQAATIAAVSVRKIVDHKETFCTSWSENNFLSSSHRHHSGQTNIFFFHFPSCRDCKLFFSHVWSKIIFVFHGKYDETSHTTSTHGITHQYDCSAASKAIFCNLKILLSLTILICEYWDGKKTICCNHNSVHFCTTSSIFSNLFGNAIHNFFSCGAQFFFSSQIISATRDFFCKEEIEHVYLTICVLSLPMIRGLCTKNVYHTFARKTLVNCCTTLSSVIVMVALSSIYSVMNNCIVQISNIKILSNRRYTSNRNPSTSASKAIFADRERLNTLCFF